jgi:hypothetical protein
MRGRERGFYRWIWRGGEGVIPSEQQRKIREGELGNGEG